MKFLYLHTSELAIKAIFDPAFVGSAHDILPDDFFVDPAKWDLDTWRLKLSEFESRIGHKSPKERSDSFALLVKHIVGLPVEQRANCLDDLLRALPRGQRVNIDEILRIAHQIKQLPSHRQDALFDRLKHIAVRTMTERRFGKDAFDALSKALNLDKPGPWSTQMQHARNMAQTSLKCGRPLQSGRTAQKRQSQWMSSTPNGSTSASALESNKRPRIAPGADMAADTNTVDANTFDTMIAEIDAGLKADWILDFEQYSTGHGSREERADTLDRLLKRLDLLPLKDQPDSVEKLLQLMNVGSPVEFTHANLLWTQLAAIRASNPGAQIATDFGRIASQWAVYARWTAEELRSADPMLKS